MSIDNIQTYYTNLTNPIQTRNVIVKADIDGGVFANGETINCSGVFGAGDIIANIQAMSPNLNLIIRAKGEDPAKDGILATIPPGLNFNGFIYAVGHRGNEACIYKQHIDGSNGSFYTIIGLGNYSYFTGVSKDTDNLYAVGRNNGNACIYKQPIDETPGFFYSLVGLTETGSNTFYGVSNDSDFIYAVGVINNNYDQTACIYKQPIDKSPGSLYLLNGLINTNTFYGVSNDLDFIYAVGSNVSYENGDACMYKQPIDGSNGEFYTINGLGNGYSMFTSVSKDSTNLYAVGVNEKASIYKQPIDGEIGSFYSIEQIGGKNFFGVSNDSTSIYTVGFNSVNAEGKTAACIYTQPINNSDGSFYSINGLDGNGLSVFNGVTITQPIDPKFANPELAQDATISITNVGSNINSESIELLITYLE